MSSSLRMKRAVSRGFSLMLMVAALITVNAGLAQAQNTAPSRSEPASPTAPADATVTRDSSPAEPVDPGEKGREWLERFLAGSKRAADVTVSVAKKWIDKIPGNDGPNDSRKEAGDPAPMRRESAENNR